MANKKSRRRGRGPVFYLLFFLLLGIFCFSGWKVGSYLLGGAEQKKNFSELSQLVEQNRMPQSETPSHSADETETAPPEETEPPILPEYAAILDLNPDLVGWIRIPGTVIDYPVMQTPDDPEYYLHHDFYHTVSEWGCIFADAACDVVTPSDNVTLYGHHMQDGSMFAGLDGYGKQEFWEDHQIVEFDSLTQYRRYRVFAVFKTSGYLGEGFPYHTFVEADSPEDFQDFVSQCKTMSFYDTGITPEYGDKLICLSTCEYTQANGRLVVVAVMDP